ncbi:DNA primase [Halogeometricum borinquense]|uniref:DNA primase DnaG n=1 Tax=Halogeometricum borinquense TaxID=60847 RepID=A0A6C0UIU0_9EURY|nr:DNA primase DnaG [Halogeometricum borinquense]QIB75436.1 DNA primase [Halogeometricum borinquense]QIQ75704.1 DNA primase [Halogeometricum borinquense]
MDDTAKYLIHAAITADGVVERSDVVGAIFGQTEGLLGDDLDLRDLQQSSKVGRIDVQIESENGQSFGNVTIASSLDKVKTAILAASLETITRVGPCQSDVRVTDIEDVREAKRREVVDRAKELLSTSFDDSIMTSSEILEEVKESVRVEDISEYEGLPAGPRVLDSDAIIVVEGRADVLTLLRYGVKNAIAVEGTNIPDAVARLTQDRTVTAFLDGDRGGELILRELVQVGDVDYVAFAPDGQSVEDLQRHEVMSALRSKVALEMLPADGSVREAATDERSDTDGESSDPPQGSPTTESATPSSETRTDERYLDPNASVTVKRLDEDHPVETTGASAERPTDVLPSERTAGGMQTTDASVEAEHESDAGSALETNANAEVSGDASSGSNGVAKTVSEAVETDDSVDSDAPDTDEATTETEAKTESETRAEPSGTEADAAAVGTAETESDADADERMPQSLREHVREVIRGDTGSVRFLNDDFMTVEERDATESFDAIRDAETPPHTVVLDGTFDQRLADVSAQRGVEHAVAAETGDFVKKPVSVRVLTADQLLEIGE